MSRQRVFGVLGALLFCGSGVLFAQMETSLSTTHTGASSAAYYYI